MALPDEPRIEFGLATPEDAQEMVDFHNEHYGRFFGSRRTPEYWLWEYYSYEPEKAVFVTARENGRLIGTTGAMPIYLEDGNRCLLVAKGRSALMLPEYRGTGIYQELIDYYLESCRSLGMDLLLSWTATPKLIPKFGALPGPALELLIRPGNLWIRIISKMRDGMPLQRRIGSIGKMVINWFLTLRIRRNPRVQPREGYQVVKEGTIDESLLKGLIERVKTGYKNIVLLRYDEEFLRWRIREHPLLKYDEYGVIQDGELRAYAFVTLSEGTVSISDVLSEDAYATTLLLITILKDFSRNAGTYRFLGNPKDYLARDLFDQLHSFGFRMNKRLTKPWNTLFIDLTGCINEDVIDFGKWHVTGLWLDSNF